MSGSYTSTAPDRGLGIAPLIVGAAVVITADGIGVEVAVADAGAPTVGVPDPQALSDATRANDVAARIMLPQYHVAFVMVHGTGAGSG
jgi:hypothetical protein